MKILELRFKNLNSLVGEWFIDFSNPEYANDGIFLISGPTGAGKTTILDAICLALYGETPRLGKITKTTNEIMSRQTAECFAEICFETKDGCFRCVWSQHRSRKKNDGELQAAKHEISDARSGKVLESKMKDVLSLIEEKIGMDFKQFTRSILLAQGGFAAFLNAKPEERSPILEQITGTEIYTNISLKVHERRSIEEKKLSLLKSELAGIVLLDEKELKHKENEIEVKSKEEEALKLNRDKLLDEIKNTENFNKEKDSLKHLELKLTETEEELVKLKSELSDSLKSRLGLKQLHLSLSEQHLKQSEKELEELKAELLKNLKDADLASALSLIQDRIASFKNLSLDIEKRKDEIQNSETKLNEDRQRFKEASSEKDRLEGLRDNNLKILIKDKILNERLLTDLDFLLDKILLSIKLKKKEQKSSLVEGLKEKLTYLENELKLLKELILASEKEKEFLLKISTLSEERKNLILGKACPLCGSLEHPFKDASQRNSVFKIHHEDDENAEITALETDMSMSQVNKILADYKTRQDNLEKDILNFKLELNSLNKDLELIRAEIESLIHSISKSENKSREEPDLSEIEELSLQLSIQSSSEKDLEKLINSISDLKELLKLIEREDLKLNKIIEEGKSLRDRVHYEKEFLDKQLANLGEIKLSLENILKEHIPAEELNTPDSIALYEAHLLKLKSKADEYKRRLNLEADLRVNIERLKAEKHEAEKALEEMLIEIKDKHSSFFDSLSLNTALNLYSNAKELKNKPAELLKAELKEKDLEFKSLETKKTGIEKNIHSLETQIRTSSENLKNLESKLNLLKSLAELINEKEDFDFKIRESVESSARLKQELSSDAEARIKYTEKKELILAQTQEFERFDKLHALIGSSTGKKYRDFVQTLSFELLIFYANQQLSSMYDRYILTMDKNIALELNVIDNYQAAEIRSTKNLSGGESFIISLSLALGLSKIVSNNVSVDSLFLDEGFGTLDTEALDIALETLASLKQSGKLIGIISHINSIKERIPVQIKVEKLSHGRSIISGAGVKRMVNAV